MEHWLKHREIHSVLCNDSINTYHISLHQSWSTGWNTERYTVCYVTTQSIHITYHYTSRGALVGTRNKQNVLCNDSINILFIIHNSNSRYHISLHLSWSTGWNTQRKGSVLFNDLINTLFIIHKTVIAHITWYILLCQSWSTGWNEKETQRGEAVCYATTRLTYYL